MIEINLSGHLKSGKKPGKIFYAASVVAVLALASGFYIKLSGDSEPRQINTGYADKTISSPSAHKVTDKERKRKASGRFKVKGFVKLMGKNLAMLVSGRKVQWVEEGQNAFGVEIVDIEENGVFIKTRSGGDGKEFFPLR